jgi:hypothetical protein
VCRRAGSSLDQRRRCAPAKCLYSLMFGLMLPTPVDLIEAKIRRSHIHAQVRCRRAYCFPARFAASSPAWSCMLGRPARSWSPAAAVLEECACRRIDLVPDRFLMRRASPSAERRRPTANRPRQRAVTIARSPHRDPPAKPFGIYTTHNVPTAGRLRAGLIGEIARFGRVRPHAAFATTACRR